MKTLNITAIIISVIAISISGYALVKKTDLFGSQMVQPYSYFGATNTSSSVPTVATTTNPILSLDNARINAKICNNSAYTVFLHPKSQATTTGVVLNEGIPLSPIGLATSTANVCAEFPGFKGYLYGISSATSAITVSSWK